MTWSDAARAAALEARRRHSKMVVYHGTSDARAAKIVKEGFRPVRVKHNFPKSMFAGSPMNATYVTPSYAWAKNFARRVSQFTGDKFSLGTVLTLKVPARKLNYDHGETYRYLHGVSKHRIIKVKKIRGRAR